MAHTRVGVLLTWRINVSSIRTLNLQYIANAIFRETLTSEMTLYNSFPLAAIVMMLFEI